MLWLAREESRASISQITLCVLKTVQDPLRCANITVSRYVRCLLVDVSIPSIIELYTSSGAIPCLQPDGNVSAPSRRVQQLQWTRRE